MEVIKSRLLHYTYEIFKCVCTFIIDEKTPYEFKTIFVSDFKIHVEIFSLHFCFVMAVHIILIYTVL